MSQSELQKCVRHPDRPAVAACVECGDAVCAACAQQAGGRYYCPRHVPAAAGDAAKPVRRVFRPVPLLVVAAVVALAWLTLYALQPFSREGAKVFQEEMNRARLAEVAAAAASFKKDMGRYPTAAEGLAALAKQPAVGGERWLGPYLPANYLRKDAVVDAGGRPLVYRVDAGGSAVSTVGPDGKAGTKDDLTVVFGEKPAAKKGGWPGLREVWAGSPGGAGKR